MKYNIFLIGPSGSGKSTFGKYISIKKKIKFIECDKLHAKKSINKMKNGIPISSKERFYWVKMIKKKIICNNKKNIIIAFSGLKKRHRDFLKLKNKNSYFILLKTSKKNLRLRLKKRKKHFFNSNLLDNQIKSFEKSRDLHILDSTKKFYINYKKILKLINR